MIAIIDYGGGNTGSVKNALDSLNIDSVVTSDKEQIKKSDKILLPGQGRFGDVMAKLNKKALDKLIISEIKNGKLYLGICVGLQILFENGEEDPDVKGLSLFKGTVPRFKISLKVPQIGWNKAVQIKKSRLFAGIKNNSFFYFVHSYFADPADQKIILSTTDYGQDFASGIEKDNIFAVQFHPEKSGKDGLRLLKNFGEL